MEEGLWKHGGRCGKESCGEAYGFCGFHLGGMSAVSMKARLKSSRESMFELRPAGSLPWTLSMLTCGREGCGKRRGGSVVWTGLWNGLWKALGCGTGCGHGSWLWNGLWKWLLAMERAVEMALGCGTGCGKGSWLWNGLWKV